MDEHDPHTLYRRWLSGMWEGAPGDLEALAGQLFTDDAVGHWPDRTVRGPDEIAALVAQTHRMFTDIRTAIEVGPITEGDLVAARWTFTATYQGGIPQATARVGTAITYQGSDTFRLRAGRFCEYWPLGDTMALMIQLGAVEMRTPPPSS